MNGTFYTDEKDKTLETGNKLSVKIKKYSNAYSMYWSLYLPVSVDQPNGALAVAE
jgi:hypothetical protein